MDSTRSTQSQVLVIIYWPLNQDFHSDQTTRPLRCRLHIHSPRFQRSLATMACNKVCETTPWCLPVLKTPSSSLHKHPPLVPQLVSTLRTRVLSMNGPGLSSATHPLHLIMLHTPGALTIVLIRTSHMTVLCSTIAPTLEILSCKTYLVRLFHHLSSKQSLSF